MNDLNIKLQQLEYWILPEYEANRRTELIKECSADIISKYQKFFNHKGIKAACQLLDSMAYLKPITDVMLTDYFGGIFHIVKFLMSKDEKDSEEIKRLTYPALTLMKSFYKTDLWQNTVLKNELSGKEVMIVNEMTIPFTSEEIIIHIRRLGKILFKGGTDNIKFDLRKHYAKGYSDEEQKNQIGIIALSNEKIITETKSKDAEVENEILLKKIANHSELLSKLSKYISGINATEFTNIIEHHSLASGTPKARWVAGKVDAYDFAIYIRMSMKKWNTCFEFPDGIKLHSKYKDKNGMVSPIVTILKQYLQG